VFRLKSVRPERLDSSGKLLPPNTWVAAPRLRTIIFNATQGSQSVALGSTLAAASQLGVSGVIVEVLEVVTGTAGKKASVMNQF